MNIRTDNQGRISRDNYRKAMKAMNHIRQLKIDALHELKRNRLLAKHMPQSAYSQAINGIKRGIADDDKVIATFKAEYRKQFEPAAFQVVEELLDEVIQTLQATEHYVRHYAIKSGDGHAAGVLNAIKDKLGKAKDFFEQRK